MFSSDLLLVVVEFVSVLDFAGLRKTILFPFFLLPPAAPLVNRCGHSRAGHGKMRHADITARSTPYFISSWKMRPTTKERIAREGRGELSEITILISATGFARGYR